MTCICPCCGNNDIEISFNNISCFHCCCCGHHWLKTDIIKQHCYYASLSGRNTVPTLDRERKLADRLQDLSSFLRDGIRIIEIGCAEGALGEQIKIKHCLEYTGVELSADANTAATILDRIVKSPATTLDDGPYDLLLAFHVLEHIPDVSIEVKHWRQLLGENGIAVVEVPRESGNPWLTWDKNPEHIHQFTAASLITLFQRTGFEVLRLTSGHFESPVYCDSLRLLIQPSPTAAARRNDLIARFHKAFPKPFAVYGIGGDFQNYVAPFLDVLPVLALFDSDPKRYGEQIGNLKITPLDPIRHAGLSILIASIRFKYEIATDLVANGVSISHIFGLDDIYGMAP